MLLAAAGEGGDHLRAGQTGVRGEEVAGQHNGREEGEEKDGKRGVGRRGR